MRILLVGLVLLAIGGLGCNAILGNGDHVLLVEGGDVSVPDATQLPDASAADAAGMLGNGQGDEANDVSVASDSNPDVTRSQGDASDAGDANTRAMGCAEPCPQGCCDSTGHCVSTPTTAACGTGGAACVVCRPGSACMGGSCSCSGQACTSGCCAADGGCLTPTSAACGSAGGACVACQTGQECGPAGKCVCDPTSCPDGCCNNDVCVTYASESAMQCGTAGAACTACSNGQACGPQGACVCNSTSCPNGCCSGATCVPASGQSSMTCGSGGNACGACASGNSCSGGACTCGGTTCTGCCNASGQCVMSSNQTCGLGGTTCATCGTNQECSAGACVCDATSCPSGCCDTSGTCHTSSNATCGTAGGACAACASTQECVSGKCACDSTSCPNGCCNGTSCMLYASQATGTCGTGGAACGSCATGQRCDTTAGKCVCDGTSCSTGCCDSSGQCQTSSTATCGTGGAACVGCTGGKQCASGGCACPTGMHDCSGTCKSNTAIDSCGSACTTTCPGPTNGSSFGSATCDGTSCGLSCNSGYTPCNGACVDLQTDASNCGACGHGCGGGSCSAALCQPVSIAPSLISPPSGGFGRGLAIDSTTMYFTDGLGTHINKCPLTGCSTPTAVYTGIGYAAELLYDVPNATLYVQDPNNNKLYSVSTGGALNWSIGIGANSWGIATDGTNVYWGQLGGIQKVARSNGGNQSTFAPVSASGIVEGVWYDPTSNDIYGFADVTPGALLQCTLAGSCTTVAPSTFNYATIGVVQGSTIYFSAAGTSPNYTDGGLYSAPVSNPTSVTAMATGANYARALGMAADSSGVYFASFQSGNVYKCGLSGCGSGPTEIGPNQGEVTAMATDSQYVYWITQGSIMRWTK